MADMDSPDIPRTAAARALAAAEACQAQSDEISEKYGFRAGAPPAAQPVALLPKLTVVCRLAPGDHDYNVALAKGDKAEAAQIKREAVVSKPVRTNRRAFSLEAALTCPDPAANRERARPCQRRA